MKTVNENSITAVRPSPAASAIGSAESLTKKLCYAMKVHIKNTLVDEQDASRFDLLFRTYPKEASSTKSPPSIFMKRFSEIFY